MLTGLISGLILLSGSTHTMSWIKLSSTIGATQVFLETKKHVQKTDDE